MNTLTLPLMALLLLTSAAHAQSNPWAPEPEESSVTAPADDATVEPALWRLSVGVNSRLTAGDTGYRALSGDSVRADMAWTAERHIASGFWGGVTFSAGQSTGQVFETIDTRVLDRRLGLMGRYRHRVTPWLALHGQAAVLAGFHEVELTVGEDTFGSHDNWVPGGRLGVGATFYFLHGSFLRLHNDLGIGLTVEALYTQMKASAYSAKGTTLGELDPSGPSLVAGFAVQF